MKKRERTVNLVSEAEVMEAQNIDLKAQMRNLEIERRSLTEMLQMHASSCSRGDAFQIPNISATIVKYLNDIGMGGSIDGKNETKATRNSAAKSTQKVQKIPSVNTLKFSTRRSQQQTNKPSAQTPNIMNLPSPVTTTSTSVRNCMISAATMNTLSPIQDCKPLPSMDMGFCEGRNESLTPTSSYCKSLMSSSSDCYAMSSPDSGFIKSPVDMANYPTLPQIKSDYIPNCDTGMLNDTATVTAAAAANQDGSIEFILKSELVDANDSPYTTVQSADRFLFDGCREAFDAEMDAAAAVCDSSLIDSSQTHMHDGGLKEHLLLQGMNNNNNSSHINNNHHHLHQHHHHTHLDPNSNPNLMHNFGAVNNLPVISSVLPQSHSTSSIIEFNTCHQYIDHSLLKGDFLSQNCDFLDSNFTTDLDSGVTTYTNNSNGCLA